MNSVDFGSGKKRLTWNYKIVLGGRWPPSRPHGDKIECFTSFVAICVGDGCKRMKLVVIISKFCSSCLIAIGVGVEERKYRLIIRMKYDILQQVH